MRKTFNLLSLSLLILFSLAVSTVSAQTVPGNAVTNGFQVADPGFEDWSATFKNKPSLAGRNAPMGGKWMSADVDKTVQVIVTVTVQEPVVFQDTRAHGGNYSARLQEVTVSAAGVTETSPSWVTLGKPWADLNGIDTGSASAGTDGGIAFTHRPDSMSVWVQRSAINKTSDGTDAHIKFNLVY